MLRGIAANSVIFALRESLSVSIRRSIEAKWSRIRIFGKVM